jgi:hypothetical protein
VPFCGMMIGAGPTVMVASAPTVPVTVTVAVPVTVPLVATTKLVNVPAVTPAVYKPVDVIVPPPTAATDQVGVNESVIPAASFATAVNCCVAPAATLAGFGETVIVASGPAAVAVTVIVALPVIVPTVATTVLVPAVVPPVNIPVVLIVPPPAVTVQVGVMATAAPFASVPTATICTVPEVESVAFGVTVIVANAVDVTGSVLAFPHELIAMAATASAVTERARLARGVSARRMRFVGKLFMRLVSLMLPA